MTDCAICRLPPGFFGDLWALTGCHRWNRARNRARVRGSAPPRGGGGACGVCAGGAERPPGDFVRNKELTGAFDKYRVVAWSDYE